MKAFLWHDIDKVHDASFPTSRGSVLIEAETLERAREKACFKLWWRNDEIVPMEGIDRNPDAVFESSNKEERVWVFPRGEGTLL